jgi:hypothetical protein
MPEASRDGLPTVSEVSRLTSRAASTPEASRDGLPTVSEASRLTSRAGPRLEQAGTARLPVRRPALPTLPYLAATVTHLKKYVSNQLTKRDLTE